MLEKMQRKVFYGFPDRLVMKSLGFLGGTSYTVDGNGTWCSHSGKLWRFLKELEIDLPYDPAIALLGIYPKDSDAMKRRDTCKPMFLAAMSTIANLWRSRGVHRKMNG